MESNVELSVFRNARFTKRDYECTNVVACRAINAPNKSFVEADESVLAGLTHLRTEAGVEYFGYL